MKKYKDDVHAICNRDIDLRKRVLIIKVYEKKMKLENKQDRF